VLSVHGQLLPGSCQEVSTSLMFRPASILPSCTNFNAVTAATGLLMELPEIEVLGGQRLLAILIADSVDQ